MNAVSLSICTRIVECCKLCATGLCSIKFYIVNGYQIDVIMSRPLLQWGFSLADFAVVSN